MQKLLSRHLSCFSFRLRQSIAVFSLLAFGVIPRGVYADLTFTVVDNGDGTTDWTISGSPLIDSPGGFINNFPIVPNFGNLTGDLFASAGGWQIGGKDLTNETLRNFGDHSVSFGFPAIMAGELATGTVTFNHPFSELTLPAVDTNGSGLFGSTTVVPEPSAFLFLIVISLGVVATRWTKKRFSRLSQV